MSSRTEGDRFEKGLVLAFTATGLLSAISCGFAGDESRLALGYCAATGLGIGGLSNLAFRPFRVLSNVQGNGNRLELGN